VSTILLERTGDASASGGGLALDASQASPADSRGGLTLDDLVTGVWEGLTAHETACCPACGGAMAPRYAAGPGVVGGACRDCASQLS
jgi:hypothetical protein